VFYNNCGPEKPNLAVLGVL